MSSDPFITLPPRPPPAGPRRSAARTVLVWGLRVLIIAAVFAVGVAVGQALEDNPRPDGARTRVRTLKPLPLPPVRTTVTVTTRATGG